MRPFTSEPDTESYEMSVSPEIALATLELAGQDTGGQFLSPFLQPREGRFKTECQNGS
jgi:hypothetical protein